MGELFDKICAETTLFDAWRRVEQKGSRGGIDRVTVAEFAARLTDNLAALRADLLTGDYVPEPFQKIHIPKTDAPGETRPLQMPTVRDKVAQEAVRAVIAPVLEKTFLDCSYAYRPGKGPQKAIRRVEHYLEAKKHWVALADIDSFFDSMDQDLTLEEVKKHIAEPEIWRLLLLWMKMGAVDTRGRWVDPLAGVAQGSVISPLLSNVYLTPFDAYMTEKGHALVRYADDLILLAPSAEAATQALDEGRAFLAQRLKLKLNTHPRPVTSLEAGFVFLGIYFHRTVRRIGNAKVDQMKAEVRGFWPRLASAQVPHLIAEINESILGWKRYYGMVKPVEQFQELDGYIAEGLARALALRIAKGELRRDADLYGMIRGLEFLQDVPPPQRKSALWRIVRRAKEKSLESKAQSPGPQARSRGLRTPSAGPTRDRQESQARGQGSTDRGQGREGDQAAPHSVPTVAEHTPEVTSERAEEKGEGPRRPQTAPQAHTLPAPDENAVAEDQQVRADGQQPAEGVPSPEQQAERAVKRQKRRYLKQAVQGAELVISEPGVFVGKTSRRVVVKKQRRVIMEIPSRQLRHVIVATPGVTLSAHVITFCAQENIPIDFLTPQGEPLARLCRPLDSLGNTGLQQLRAVHDGSGLRLARAFVYGKLKNQLNLVKYYHKYRKRVDEDFARAFEDVEKEFDALLAELKAFAPAGEEYDAVRQRLFAFEGRGGNLYWQMIRLLLEDDVEFAGRERRGATDLVNSLLNYGYGMLYPRVHHALVLAGLNPCVSFLHTFQDGKPTLVFDMIEEFRPQAVDRVIFSMITKGEELAIDPKTSRLTKETVRKVIQNVLERLATPVRYRSQEKPLQEVIQLQAKLLAAHLHGKEKYRPFVARW